MDLICLRRMLDALREPIWPRLHSLAFFLPFFASSPLISLKSRSMRSYYYDNLPGDQREPHDAEPSRLVDLDTLQKLGIFHNYIPPEDHEAGLNKIASERNYKNRDIIHVCRTSMGEVREDYAFCALVCVLNTDRGEQVFDEKLKTFFHE
jgi:hypothetical protein